MGNTAVQPQSNQAANLEGYRARVRPLVNPSNPYRFAPVEMPEALAADFQLLLNLSRHPEAVFAMLQALETEVVELSEITGHSLETAFMKKLEVLEEFYGFMPAICVPDFLQKKEFLGLLQKGFALADDYWLNTDHTRDSHRLMSIVHAQYLERVRGDRFAYQRLYRFMGNAEWTQTVDWTSAGFSTLQYDNSNLDTCPDLFAMLYDTKFFAHADLNIDAQDFTNPCFMGLMREFLPGLAGWK